MWIGSSKEKRKKRKGANDKHEERKREDAYVGKKKRLYE
jgi:hypothetical protein